MAPITLLAGDLGGTKTLLATYQVDGSSLIKTRSKRYASGQWPDFRALLAHFLADCEVQPSAGCLAVAGPVRQGRVKLTNLPWQLDEDALGQALGLEHLELVNDFAVLIYGLPHLAAEQQAPLWQPAGSRDPQAPVAILGAGTGLGVALGVPTEGGLVAVATEASHAEFAPRNRDEWELKQWLIEDLGLERVSIERIVSGTGLGEVMRWVLSPGPVAGGLRLGSGRSGPAKPLPWRPLGGRRHGGKTLARTGFSPVPGSPAGQGAHGRDRATGANPGPDRPRGRPVQRRLQGPDAAGLIGKLTHKPSRQSKIFKDGADQR